MPQKRENFLQVKRRFFCTLTQSIDMFNIILTWLKHKSREWTRKKNMELEVIWQSILKNTIQNWILEENLRFAFYATIFSRERPACIINATGVLIIAMGVNGEEIGLCEVEHHNHRKTWNISSLSRGYTWRDPIRRM